MTYYVITPPLPRPSSTGEDSVLPSELKAIAEEKTGGRIAIVAVDATWGNALRTKQGYPKGVLHGEEGGLWGPGGRQQVIDCDLQCIRGSLFAGDPLPAPHYLTSVKLTPESAIISDLAVKNDNPRSLLAPVRSMTRRPSWSLFSPTTRLTISALACESTPCP